MASRHTPATEPTAAMENSLNVLLSLDDTHARVIHEQHALASFSIDAPVHIPAGATCAVDGLPGSRHQACQRHTRRPGGWERYSRIWRVTP